MGREEVGRGFLWVDLREGDFLEDIILCRGTDSMQMNLKGTAWGGVVWIDLAQDRDRWRAVVNIVIHLDFHNMQGIS
jgi:hypothetical protein